MGLKGCCEHEKEDSCSELIYSIITVSLNARQRIEETAESVSSQQFEAFEWIVIDGGSTDGTLQFLEREKGVNHLVSEPDDGIYDAMNKGIQYAHGSYCLFLNAGDILHGPAVLKRCKKYLRTDLVVGEIKIVSPDNPAKEGIRRFDTQDIRKKYLYSRTLPHQSTFIKKELFLAHGLYEKKFMIAGDHDFFARVLTRGATLSFAPCCVSVYCMDGISTTMKNSQIYRDEIAKIRKRNFTFFYRLRRRILDFVSVS